MKKKLGQIFRHFFLGLCAGFGGILILYCLTLPAKPFVYVGF